MAYLDAHDAHPLIMQHDADRRPETSLPEVVPVESLKENTIRHDDSYYKYSAPTQPFSPLAHSNEGSSSAYTSAVTSHPAPWNDGSTIGVKGFEKTSRKKFAILVALAIFLLTALALGTGLGIPLAKCRNQLDPNNYAALQPLKINTLRKSAYCNNNGKLSGAPVFTTRNGDASFDLKCGVIFQEGLPAFDPANNGSKAKGTVRNIAAIVSYSVSDCLHACASLNNMTENVDQESPKCQSVTFIPAMKGALDMYDGNCFLKNSTLFQSDQASVSVSAVSAEVRKLRSQQ